MISIIANELNSLKIDKKTLRNFGLLFFVVLSAIAGYLYWKGHGLWPWFMGGGGVSLAVALFSPYLLKPFYKVWMALAFSLGFIMTRVLLTLAFFLIFTPLGLVLKILRKDLLHEKIDLNAGTYWRRHEPITDKSRYLKHY